MKYGLVNIKNIEQVSQRKENVIFETHIMFNIIYYTIINSILDIMTLYLTFIL